MYFGFRMLSSGPASGVEPEYTVAGLSLPGKLFLQQGDDLAELTNGSSSGPLADVSGNRKLRDHASERGYVLH